MKQTDRKELSLNKDTLVFYETLYKERCKQICEVTIINGKGNIIEPYKILNDHSFFDDIIPKDIFDDLIRIKNNRRNKRYRTKQKYKEIFQLSLALKESKIVFGTITLNDYYLSLKEDTYIRKIHKWLKSHFVYSILNKDFGDKTSREHYHFIGLTIEPLEQCLNALGEPKKSKKGYFIYELQKKDYTLGFEPTLCLIDLKKDDLNKTINYLLKLNNHSSKITTKNRVRIIKKPILNLLEKRKIKD